MISLSVRVCVRPVRKKWLSPFYSTYWCYIHKTCTNCSSWHDLLIPHGSLCPWPTFHAWVTMVRKKWLSGILQYLRVLRSSNLHQVFILTWSTDTMWWFVSLTYISRLSDHGQEEIVRSILQYLLVLHSPNLHQVFILTWSSDATWWFVFLAYISRSSDQATKWQ